MWILDCSGDFLEGKRLWLKPGKSFLLGRTKHPGIERAIDHKTVSRKHFLIQVYDVDDQTKQESGARTRVRIEDLGSKTGTTVNDNLLKKAETFPTDSVISIRPGSCPQVFTMTWTPQVVTVSLSKKEVLKGELGSLQQRFSSLDVRVINEYRPGETTILIAQKRNTPKVLQALIEGVPVVKSTYLEAMLAAASVTDPETLSNLERDFDAAWPDCDPAVYLPPPGKEITDKSIDAYRPDPARATIFAKHTFFFFEQAQMDILLPPITTGHGKASLLPNKDGNTTVSESVAVIRSVTKAGHAIIVKPNEMDDSQLWWSQHIDQVCLNVGIEPIVQADILDAVLGNDAKKLRKFSTLSPSEDCADSGPAMISQSGASNVASAQTTSWVADTDNDRDSLTAEPRTTLQQQTPEDDNPRPRKRLRPLTTKRKVVAFDDEFDPDAVTPYEDDSVVDDTSNEPDPAAPSQPAVKDEPQPTTQVAENVVDDSEDAEMDRLLPATTAMRRQQQAQEAEARRKGLPLKSVMAAPKTTEAPKPKKEVKLIDVRETARAMRAAEDEQYMKEKEELHDMLAKDGEFGNKPAKLVNLVYIDLPERRAQPQTGTAIHGSTWRSEWEGRANFKGFRRRGNANALPPKVIIPLVSQASQIADNDSDSGPRQSRGRRRRGLLAGQESSEEDERAKSKQPGTIRSRFAATMAKRAREASRNHKDVPVEARESDDDDVMIRDISTTARKRPAFSPPAGTRRHEKQPRVTRRPKKSRFGVPVSDDSESSDNSSRLRRQRPTSNRDVSIW